MPEPSRHEALPAEGSAVLSEDGCYRYLLTRSWAGEPRWVHRPDLPGPLVWIMLNPSTADGRTDDQTIRRVMAFTRKFGHPGAIVVNLFALRATDPEALLTHPDPVGPDNDAALEAACAQAGRVVAAWGDNPAAKARAAYVLDHVLDGVEVLCLGTTRAGAPRHPSRLSGDTALTELRPVTARAAPRVSWRYPGVAVSRHATELARAWRPSRYGGGPSPIDRIQPVIVPDGYRDRWDPTVAAADLIAALPDPPRLAQHAWGGAGATVRHVVDLSRMDHSSTRLGLAPMAFPLCGRAGVEVGVAGELLSGALPARSCSRCTRVLRRVIDQGWRVLDGRSA